MSGFAKYLLYLTLIVLVPAAVAVGWWFYWPTYRLAQAEKALASGDATRAESLLKDLTRQAPDNLRATFLYARVLRRLNRPAEAQGVLWRAMQLGLSEAEGRREFALDEAAKAFTPNAEANLQQVLKERPDDPELLQALAEGYAQTHRWADADRCYTRWLEVEPDRLDVIFARGRTRLSAVEHLTGRAEDAAGDFRAVLRRSPDHFEARLYLAHCYLSDARIPEAKAELLRCRQLRPERIEPLIGLSACAVEERDWDEAERLLRDALQRDANSTYALGMFGDLYVRRQRFEEAIPYFQKVVSLEPDNKGAHLKLAQAFRYRGRLDEAREQERIFEELRAASAHSP